MTRTLTLATHDLPPRWDGRPVEWGKWESEWTIHICPPPPSTTPCAGCGLIRPTSFTTGRYTDKTPGRFYVARCTHCGHDQVTDPNRNTWDLDPDDYKPAGSLAR